MDKLIFSVQFDKRTFYQTRTVEVRFVLTTDFIDPNAQANDRTDQRISQSTNLLLNESTN